MRTPTAPAERQRRCRSLHRAAHDGALRETVVNRITAEAAEHHRRPWSEEEDRFIRDTLFCPPAFVARHTSRTLFAVLHRRTQLRALRKLSTP
jgi:hypothetical protein